MRPAAFAFGLTVSFAGAARAETPAPTPPVSTLQRDIGTAFVAGGAVTASVGAGMYVLTRPSGEKECKCASTSWIFPAVLMGLGSALILDGIPIWVAGQRKLDRAKLQTELRVGPLGGSVRIAF